MTNRPDDQPDMDAETVYDAGPNVTPPTPDAVDHYLREIGRVPLLNAAEEVELAERIARGVSAAKRLASAAPNDPQLRAALCADVERGDAARHHLIQANLRLVVSIAKKYVGHGMSLLDLIQEGNLGLMRAADTFDVSKGNRFSTYATWWIRQAVSRALAEKGRTIRLPVHLGEDVGKVKRASERLGQALGRPLSVEELAEDLGLSQSRVATMLKASRLPISLETPVGEEGDQTLGDFVEDRAQTSPIEAVAQRLMQRDILAALDILSERERRILTLRYGIADGRHRTLEEVGRELGMTRERARQIEAEALQRLRTSDVGSQLRDYLE
jgi:RNA polymerase primary sigma factor